MLFGQPGVGKGTYGDLLTKDLDLIKITPGDLIRDALKNQENIPGVLFKKLKFQVETGQLIDDEIVQDLVMSEFN